MKDHRAEQDWIINHLGESRETYLKSVAPPIFPTVNFAYQTVAEMREDLAHEDTNNFYTRGNNPTITQLCDKMAALEGTEAALAFASGSAAIAAGVMNQLRTGDHVVCIQKSYSWTGKLLTQYLQRFGVAATFVDGRETENFAKAIRSNTKLIYLESPNSWTFELQDITAAVKVAKAHGITTMIDNSYCTPVNFKPAELGVDIIVHAATKYLSGHSDAVGGILCCSGEMRNRIFNSELMTIGGIISPFNAWLIMRGMRTLSLRMDRVATSGLEIASRLEKEDKVANVYYPFLPSHPQYDLAQKQFKKGAGQFTVELATTDVAEVEAFCNRLKTFTIACSWGGYESLIFPAMALDTSLNYSPTSLAPNMIRFYVGLEDVEYLWGDLKAALDEISSD